METDVELATLTSLLDLNEFQALLLAAGKLVVRPIEVHDQYPLIPLALWFLALQPTNIGLDECRRRLIFFALGQALLHRRILLQKLLMRPVNCSSTRQQSLRIYSHSLS